MGGPSFLLNKKFHPKRLDNQKRVFIAEQTTQDKKRREEEAAKEVQKEAELHYYEALGETAARDPRNSSLKFMYALPTKKDDPKDNPGTKAVNAASVVPLEAQHVPSGQDDELVQRFWTRIQDFQETQKLKSMGSTEPSAAASNSNTNNTIAASSTSSSVFHFPGDGRSLTAASVATAASVSLGRDRTKEKELNPMLRNAPVEGSYVRNMQGAHFKPFNEPVRNIQCTRCGDWGHRFGDRECPLRDFNPHDLDRQRREDPMAGFAVTARGAEHSLGVQSAEGLAKLTADKQRLVLSQAMLDTTFGKKPQAQSTQPVKRFDDAGTVEPTSNITASILSNAPLIITVDESDPEAEFIATLTAREKKLLLRKLQVQFQYNNNRPPL